VNLWCCKCGVGVPHQFLEAVDGEITSREEFDGIPVFGVLCDDCSGEITE